jgi:purine nucleosidase
MAKKKIMIDADPGIDDSLAILLALISPELEVEAFTIVGGNSPVEEGVTSALSLLEMAGGGAARVAGGMQIPLVIPHSLPHEVQTATGIAYSRLPEIALQGNSREAVDLLINRLLASPGEITVITTGPLTNLAMAVRLEPRIISAAREVIIAGGAIRQGGNATPLAEFNIYWDPYAAHVLFHSGIPITLIPLDATQQAILTRQDVERLQAIPSPISFFLAESILPLMEYHDEEQTLEGCVLNDALAVALMIEPALAEMEAWFVDVDLSGGVSMGKTFADFNYFYNKMPNMQVTSKVQARKYIDLFLERIEQLCRLHPG